MPLRSEHNAGIDALTDATIRIRRGNDIYTGRGEDSDIVVASGKAYMRALNKLIDRVTPSLSVPASVAHILIRLTAVNCSCPVADAGVLT